MTDLLEIPCGGCGRALKVASEHAGKMARCPVCGNITQVPAGLAAGNGASSSSEQYSPSSSPPTALANPASSTAPISIHGSPISIHGNTAEWYMKTPEEQTFGPASFPDLERWVQEGRITSDCQLCQGSAGNWQPADWLFPSLKTQPVHSPQYSPPGFSAPPAVSVYPSSPGNSFGSQMTYSPARYVAPHRGPLILVLALMGLFIQCPIFPFMTWVMGSNDLREMQAGRMDPSGRDLTRAGMVIGMVLSVLWILGFLFIFLVMLAGIAGK